ncbi:hypothetical protein OPKNFCMD_2155 [Methylobacterium crusticola]|uniref:3',5'-cyclic-nucleotide phosphodiesterase n=1 Tax=Methylobacterium crusticola TaxID=1697972 RepID=A0ABQ4QVN9_9HYPH|nr:hypothetical protein [Methylobacterium crusticola]GJD49425.1 hypothetical protein OPKNFCMD_2155 [Methylobacterium crusticola]
MRKHARAAGLAVLAAVTTTAVSAQESSAQRAACTPDVIRLCFGDIPDVPRIKACLRRERQNLSTACQEVFNAVDRGGASASATTRRRG